MKTCTVLSVDDGEDDTLLLQQACRKSLATFKLQVVTDGQKAMDYLSGVRGYEDRERFPLPELLLLDLKMPRKSGFDVLDWIRQQPSFKDLPVVVFSSSQDDVDIARAYEKGATWFLMKPVDFEVLVHLVSVINQWEISRDPSLFARLASYHASRHQT